MGLSELTLSSLPDELFELVIKHAVEYHDGHVPFSAWYLTAVNRRFRQCMFRLITKVTLSTTTPLWGNTAAAHILSASLLKCRHLRSLNIRECDALTDTTVGRFLRSGPRLQSFCAAICLNQTVGLLDDLSARAAGTLRSIELWGCDRARHLANAPSAASANPNRAFHPCTKLGDNGIQRLTRQCRDLRAITLCKALSLTDASLRAIASLTKLSSLTLRRLTGITDNGMTYLAHGSARLRVLNLQSCATLTDASLHTLAHGRATRALDTLLLSHNPRFTTAGVHGLILSLRRLLDVRCDQCGDVTGGWGVPLRDSRRVQHITFRGPSISLTPSEASDLVSLGATRLSVLDLSLSPTVDAAVLRAIRDVAPCVESLFLRSCPKLDDDAIIEVSKFKALRCLDVSKCAALSWRGTEALVKSDLGQQLNDILIGPIVHNGRSNSRHVLHVILNHCRAVKRLSICGEIDEMTILWLRQNCTAYIEMAHLVVRRQNGTNNQERIGEDGKGGNISCEVWRSDLGLNSITSSSRTGSSSSGSSNSTGSRSDAGSSYNEASSAVDNIGEVGIGDSNSGRGSSRSSVQQLCMSNNRFEDNHNC